VALFVHGTTFAFVLFSIIGGSISPPAAALSAGGFAMISVIWFVVWERRLPIARRPALWMRRSTLVVLPHSVAFGIAAAAIVDGIAPPTSYSIAAFASATLLIEFIAIRLASRTLRRPLSADLGELDVEVLTKIRPASEGMPVWLGNDDVRLTHESLLITVRPDSKWAFVETIRLSDIVEVDTRTTQPQDGPWLEVDGGRMFWPPSGDVVVVTHRDGARRLPVQDPAGFAEVLRARVRKATSAREGKSPGGVGERDSG
jgi:hypothetical protein